MGQQAVLLDVNTISPTPPASAAGRDPSGVTAALFAAARAGIQVLTFDVADHATQNIDTVITAQPANVTPGQPVALQGGFTLLYALLMKTSANAGAFANTVQVQKGVGGTAVTNAMSLNGVNDQGLVLPTSIDDSQFTFAIGDTLRIVQTKAGGDAAFKLYLLVLPT